MAKYKFEHQHTKHLILQDGKAEKPWAHFKDGIFETDDPKIIQRLKSIEGVSEVIEESADTAETA